MTMERQYAKTSFLLMLLMAVTAVMADEHPRNVVKFYNGLSTLGTTHNAETAYGAREEMASCFWEGQDSGLELDMDGLQEKMTSTKYTMELYQHIYKNRDWQVSSCNIIKTKLTGQPDQTGRKGGTEFTHSVTYVTKVYVQDGRSVSYNDVVETINQSGLITEIMNVSSFDDMSLTATPVSSGDAGVEQLRARAAFYYTEKNYVAAYECYEMLLQRSPYDGDAAYRIALMTFWRKGCKHRFSKDAAERLAKQYIEVAIEYGNPLIVQKALNVKNNWDRKNIYF